MSEQITIPGTETADKTEKRTVEACLHAIMQHAGTKEVTTIRAARRRDLSKAIGDMLDYNVVGVFKGKQLKVREKKTFNID